MEKLCPVSMLVTNLSDGLSSSFYRLSQPLVYWVLLAMTCLGFARVMSPNTLRSCNGLLPVQNTLGTHAAFKTILHENTSAQKKKTKRTRGNRKHSASLSFDRIQMSQNGLWPFHTHHPVHSLAIATAPPPSSHTS